MPANLDLFITKLFHPPKALTRLPRVVVNKSGGKQDDQTHSPHQYFVIPSV